MTENDYIAEYIKEKYPELIDSPKFHAWKIGKQLNSSLKVLTDTIVSCCNAFVDGFMSVLNCEVEDDEPSKVNLQKDDLNDNGG